MSINREIPLVGPCAYCGKWLGIGALKRQTAIIATGPEGTARVCVRHFDPEETTPQEREDAMDAIAGEKALQLACWVNARIARLGGRAGQLDDHQDGAGKESER